MDMQTALEISSHTMRKQAPQARLRAIAQDLARAHTTAGAAGARPSRCQVIALPGSSDRWRGTRFFDAVRIVTDPGQFPSRCGPSSAAADWRGAHGQTPCALERGNDANLAVVRTLSRMLSRTLDMLK